MQPRLSVWGTLAKSASLLRSTPGWIPLAYAPVALASLLSVRLVDTKVLTPSQMAWETLLVLPLQTIVANAILHGAFQRLRGRSSGLGESLRVGLGRLLVVLGVSILVGIMGTLGFLLLVVPGLIVLTTFYLATVVAVLERRGVIASLRRSAQLTRGNRLRLLGLTLVLGLPTVGSVLLRGSPEASAGRTLLWALVTYALGLLMAVTPAVVYARLLDLRGEPDPTIAR